MDAKAMVEYVLQNGTLALDSEAEAQVVIQLAAATGNDFAYDTFPTGVFEVYDKRRPDLDDDETGRELLSDVHVHDFIHAETPEEAWVVIERMHLAGLRRLLLHLHRHIKRQPCLGVGGLG